MTDGELSERQIAHLHKARMFAKWSNKKKSTSFKIMHLIKVSEDAKIRATSKIIDLLVLKGYTIHDLKEFNDDAPFMKELNDNNFYNIIDFIKLEEQDFFKTKQIA